MKRLGTQTIKFDNPITILETASIVGPKESEGPMAKYFDKCLEDEFWEEKTWEKYEYYESWSFSYRYKLLFFRRFT